MLCGSRQTPGVVNRICAILRAIVSEIPLTLAILHGCFAALVIVSVPALGLSGRSHLLDNLLQAGSLRQDSTSTGRIAYRPEPYYSRLQLFILQIGRASCRESVGMEA